MERNYAEDCIGAGCDGYFAGAHAQHGSREESQCINILAEDSLGVGSSFDQLSYRKPAGSTLCQRDYRPMGLELHARRSNKFAPKSK